MSKGKSASHDPKPVHASFLYLRNKGLNLSSYR
jgi:hypothetical protein